MAEQASAEPLITAEELRYAHPPNQPVELVRGRLILREPAGFQHGVVAARLAARLSTFVDERSLGAIVAAETGFRLFSNPDTVRAGDAAFISRERMPDPGCTGFPVLAPDLVAEVLSPDDRAGEVLAKVGDWLTAGARLVWVIDPIRRYARVYRADGSEARVADHELLDGEDVLPGFNCTLAEILQTETSASFGFMSRVPRASARAADGTRERRRSGGAHASVRARGEQHRQSARDADDV